MTQGPKRYLKSEFAKNVAVMFSGNGLAMLFPLIMGPLISRIYSPQDFAGFELFIKLATLAAVIAALRFELAIILPKAQSEADSLFKLSIKILLIVSAFTLVTTVFWGDDISHILANNDLKEFIWLLPLAVFMLGANNIFTAYVIRLRKFKMIASNKVLGTLSSNGSKYILGLWSSSGISLVWGHILGVFIPTIAFLKNKAIRISLRSLFKQEVPSKTLFKKYRDFPIVNSSHAFFDEGQKALLLFIISAYHGEIVLGLFAFAWRYLKVPLQVLGSSLSQVLNEKWARDVEQGINIRPAVLKMIWLLLGISIIPFTVLFFFGTPIFGFVFGDNWEVAGTYAEWMAPWLMLNFLSTPISFLPILVNKQKLNFYLAVIGNVITLGLVFYFSIMDFSFEHILWAIVGSNIVYLIVLLFWYVHIAGQAVYSKY